jgi:cytochrome b subunit of formate dehydrogenase
MAIDPQAGARQAAATAGPRREVVQRYNRLTRWFHAGIYLTVLPLLATGWWLLLGQEGDPSLLARVISLPDTVLHRRLGWVLLGVAGLGLLLGIRAVGTFLRETARFRRSDLGWFARWPRAVFTGRFGWHDGHFDPGQRIANVVITLSLVAVVGTGVGLAVLHGGPAFVWLVRVHRWSTYVLTPVLVGHILITVLPPGYRGVWRSMHFGGRLDARVAGRLWPGWLARRGRSRTGQPR